MQHHLVIMAKEPVAGAVKSRLAAEIGVTEATRFYRASLASLLRRLGHDRRWHTVLAVTPDRATGAFQWRAGLPRMGQGRGDLGARMQGVFDRLPPGPAVIVGSDIPGISAAHVAAAFAALGRSDAVFGPAEDGGYWLVGLRRRPAIPRIFSPVRWSGPHALADTLANCRGLNIAFLDRLADVDTAAEWRRWRRLTG